MKRQAIIVIAGVTILIAALVFNHNSQTVTLPTVDQEWMSACLAQSAYEMQPDCNPRLLNQYLTQR